MELTINPVHKKSELIQTVYTTNQNPKPFIEANTKTVTLEHLTHDTILPVFSKDNEETISHGTFIQCMQQALQEVFPTTYKSSPEIRVSHVIKGRVPEAVGKPLKELTEQEKTIYYERMAFTIELPEIQQQIQGNSISLVAGGVRAYNTENLYSKKTVEKFKIFIGFKNLVCTNLCVSTDGFKDEVRVSSPDGLYQKMVELISNYDYKEHVDKMQSLTKCSIDMQQFSHMIGKLKLVQYSKEQYQNSMQNLEINDKQINSVVKGYLADENFGVQNNQTIDLWKLYNLFTEAIKSSYIDSFLQRHKQVGEFIQKLAYCLKNDIPNYYLM